MRRLAFISAGLLAALATQAMAQSLTLPSPAVRTYQTETADGGFALPLGPFRDGVIQTKALAGGVSRETWRLDGGGASTHSLIQNLAAQLTDAGYEVLLQCDQDTCGGFDFRFGIDVVGEPHMHVDLGDFQFLSAQKSDAEGDHYVSVIVSRSPGAGFVQITRIGPQGAPETDVNTVTSTMTGAEGAEAAPDSAPIADQLEQNGFAILSDLEFNTGSSDLGDGPFDTLGQLAAYLVAHPDRTVALVGHTDAEGSLEGNIALSKRRAQSVRNRLINEFSVPASQMAAEGVGFLSPVGSNLTEEGRTRNRRVEVVLTSTR
ncbi:MAG TPA: OmpA family protein [Aliiroseovarius sp.]|nr:OmpA family protein [Aliiroseovarius sp.]